MQDFLIDEVEAGGGNAFDQIEEDLQNQLLALLLLELVGMSQDLQVSSDVILPVGGLNDGGSIDDFEYLLDRVLELFLLNQVAVEVDDFTDELVVDSVLFLVYIVDECKHAVQLTVVVVCRMEMLENLVHHLLVYLFEMGRTQHSADDGLDPNDYFVLGFFVDEIHSVQERLVLDYHLRIGRVVCSEVPQSP